MRSIVVDLDGTIFDVSHRIHLAHAKDWDAFHAACENDKLHLDVMTLVRLFHFNGNYDIIVCTGRKEAFRKITEAQLVKHGILADVVLMRPDDDFSKDGPMKLKLLDDYFGGREKVLSSVVFALDDRDDVVEYFRNNGIKTWQCRNGTY